MNVCRMNLFWVAVNRAKWSADFSMDDSLRGSMKTSTERFGFEFEKQVQLILGSSDLGLTAANWYPSFKQCCRQGSDVWICQICSLNTYNKVTVTTALVTSRKSDPWGRISQFSSGSNEHTCGAVSIVFERVMFVGRASTHHEPLKWYLSIVIGSLGECGSSRPHPISE